MKRKNCWEHFECKREPGGSNTEELGVCPVTIPGKYNGINKGLYAGRFCWAITGTYRTGGPICTYALKLLDCLNCEFMKQVIFKEGDKFILSPDDADKAIEKKKQERLNRRRKKKNCS